MMCNDLESLINRENTILLDKGTITFDAMFTRKINLLNKFETDIRRMLLLVKEHAPDNQYLRRLLVDKIQEVQGAVDKYHVSVKRIENENRQDGGFEKSIAGLLQLCDEGNVICH